MAQTSRLITASLGLSKDLDTSDLAALVAYEHICTIDQEINLIWRRKWTGVTVLFVVNRYLLLLITILVVVPDTPPKVCIFIFFPDSAHMHNTVMPL